MSLLNITDILNTNKPEIETSATKNILNHNSGNIQFVNSTFNYLHKAFNLNFDNNFDSIIYTSNGKFSVHNLIHYLIHNINEACNLFLSTFSISPQAARLLLGLKAQYLLTDVTLYFDNKTRTNNAKTIKLIENDFNLIFTKVHAKIFLLFNENTKYCHIGSSNLNQNNRLETGILFNNLDVFNFYHNLFINGF